MSGFISGPLLKKNRGTKGAVIGAGVGAIFGGGPIGTAMGAYLGHGQGGLDDKLPPTPKPRDPPPLKAKPKAPGNLPGEEDITQAATIADEKRRLLSGLPKSTRTRFAREMPVSDGMIGKRVLGGGAGRTTTGE